MLIHLIVCVVLGAVVSAVTNIGFLFWVVAIAAFICGLPFALITSFVHNEVSYAQDRADDRAAMAEIAAEERAEWHEMEADGTYGALYRSFKELSANVCRQPASAYPQNSTVASSTMLSHCSAQAQKPAGRAAWMPLGLCKALRALASKCGGTPPHFDKLKICHGWQILSRVLAFFYQERYHLSYI